MKKTMLIFILFSMTAFNLFPQATRGRGILAGTVLDQATGHPIQGVTVKLYSLRAQAYHEPNPKTDAGGKWKAIFLRGGEWNIDFLKEGFESRKISIEVRNTAGAKRPDIKIYMRKREEPEIESQVADQIKEAAHLYEEKRYGDALLRFEQILAANREGPARGVLNRYIGNCHAGLKNYEKAIEAYKIALEIYPEEMELLLAVANAYLNLDKDYDALDFFRKIPMENLEDPGVLYNIGAILYNTGGFREAAAYFKKVVQVDGNNAPAYFQLGMTYTALGNTTEALAALETFVRMAPQSPDYQTARAVIEAYAKRYR